MSVQTMTRLCITEDAVGVRAVARAALGRPDWGKAGKDSVAQADLKIDAVEAALEEVKSAVSAAMEAGFADGASRMIAEIGNEIFNPASWDASVSDGDVQLLFNSEMSDDIPQYRSPLSLKAACLRTLRTSNASDTSAQALATALRTIADQLQGPEVRTVSA